MANAVYPKFKEAILGGAANADMLAGDVKAILIDTDTYTYDAGHEFLSDLSGIIATSANLTGKTVTDGAFNSDDTVFTAATGAESEALGLFIDTGTPATSRVVLFLDTDQTNLPVTPNGGDINITVAAAGWFKLGS